MTQKRGFFVGIGSGIALAVAIFFFMRRPPSPVAQPSPAPAAAVAAPPSAGKELIAGSIDVDPAAKVTLPAVMFVIARTEGEGKGHPVLAKRMAVTSFPVRFTLASTDAMMDSAPPAHVLLEARIDLDGDAITRDIGAATGSIPSVALGATDVKVILR